MRSRDLGWLLLLVALAASKSSRAARSPSSAPLPPPEGEPNYNMSPEEQAERLPISTGEWFDLQRGRAYRFSGDLESASPIDTAFVRRAMEAIGARDVSIGEKPPHRMQWIMTSPVNHRVQIGKPVPIISSVLGGVSLRLRSVRAIRGSSVVVGKGRG